MQHCVERGGGLCGYLRGAGDVLKMPAERPGRSALEARKSSTPRRRVACVFVAFAWDSRIVEGYLRGNMKVLASFNSSLPNTILDLLRL